MEVYLSVLSALLERPHEFRRGLALSRAARVAADGLYFNLMWLEGCGWVESAWDVDSSTALSHRVPRRHYRLTALGKLEAAHVISGHSGLTPLFFFELTTHSEVLTVNVW